MSGGHGINPKDNSMTHDDQQDPKGGNNEGSRVHQSTRDGAREPDQQPGDEPNATEGADPASDIRQQNPGETTTADLADKVDRGDPHKAEKLTKAGRPDFDPDESAD
jgi:hypothetical protein